MRAEITLHVRNTRRHLAPSMNFVGSFDHVQNVAVSPATTAIVSAGNKTNTHLIFRGNYCGRRHRRELAAVSLAQTVNKPPEWDCKLRRDGEYLICVRDAERDTQISAKGSPATLQIPTEINVYSER